MEERVEPNFVFKDDKDDEIKEEPKKRKKNGKKAEEASADPAKEHDVCSTHKFNTSSRIRTISFRITRRAS